MTVLRTGNNVYVVQSFGFGAETAGNNASTVLNTVPQALEYGPLVEQMRLTLPILGDESWTYRQGEQEVPEEEEPEIPFVRPTIVVAPSVVVQQSSRI